MKKILLTTTLSLIILGCYFIINAFGESSNFTTLLYADGSTYKGKSGKIIVKPFMKNADLIITRVIEPSKKGGEKVTVPDETVRTIVNELITQGYIPGKYRTIMIKKLKAFFPLGGKLTVFNLKNWSKNFTLGYYQKGSQVRIVANGDNKVIAFILWLEDRKIAKKIIYTLR